MYKNKILIVEGMDRCAKSSFIKLYRKAIVNPFVMTMHFDSPPNVEDKEDWSKKHYSFNVSTARRMWNSKVDIIFDRSHLGEWVYGDLYRGNQVDWVFDLHKRVLLLDRSQFDDYGDDLIPNIEIVVMVDTGDNLVSRDDGLSMTSNVEGFNKEYTRWQECVKMIPSSEYQKIRLIDWSKKAFSKEALKEIVDDIIV